MKQTLRLGLPRLGLSLTDNQVDTLCQFGELLLEKNQVMNLTAIKTPEKVAELHFLDSLALLGTTDFQGKSVIDVGCGAGFPGVPLKIGCPELRLTLLDSLGKRMDWLREVLPSLGVDANVITARAEEYAEGHREQFDLCVSRAVARLNILCELCLPLVKVGGKFLAMKGAQTREEAEEAKNAIAALGGKVAGFYEYTVEDATHYAVIIQKVKPTPAIFPRDFGKIKKKPL